MAVVFADPFGSYISGFERGQEAEMDFQQHALDTFTQEMELLDRFVLAPQRQLAREQRQYARELDLLARRQQGERQRQEERILLSETAPGRTSRVVVDGTRTRPVLGGLGVISEPGSARVEGGSTPTGAGNITGIGERVPGTPYFTGT